MSQSDNPVLQDETKVHGTNSEVPTNQPSRQSHTRIPQQCTLTINYCVQNAEMGRVHRTAELPDAALQSPRLSSGMGNRANNSGSGKGRHNPRTTGQKKGTKAHMMDGADYQRRQQWNM